MGVPRVTIRSAMKHEIGAGVHHLDWLSYVKALVPPSPIISLHLYEFCELIYVK